MNHEFDNDNRQFVISYELLQLFKWFFEHEQESLKAIIEAALSEGLQERFVKTKKIPDQELANDLQQSVVDFFALLETLLFEVINEHEIKKVVQKNLIPEASHIDTSACDKNLISSSMAKVASLSRTNPKESTKTLLYKELLKRWKPAKKVSIN